MMRSMRNDPDPRFKKSKYINFLDKLSTGEWKIKGKDLLKD